MKKETKNWLKKAEKDFDDAIFNFKNNRNQLAAFLFHQAMEKALKAIQIEEKGKYDYSHDLLALANKKALKKFKGVMKDLNPVYTGFRYPDVNAEVEELREIRNEVERFMKWTKKRLRR